MNVQKEIPGLEIPNLDGMDQEDLHIVELQLVRIANYAKAKRQAMFFRKAGYIKSALCAEGDCERYYAQIPKYLRW